jgi:hypothetical protein
LVQAKEASSQQPVDIYPMLLGERRYLVMLEGHHRFDVFGAALRLA